MLDTETILSFSNGVVEAIGVHIRTRNLVVIVVYRQPDNPKQEMRSDTHAFKSFLSEVDRVFKELPTPTPDVLLCGDFNLPHAEWNSGTCSGANPDEKSMFEDLKSLSTEHSLTQMIDGPTHRHGNTLDLIFTNNINYIHSFTSNVTALSDHYIVECKVCYIDTKPTSCYPEQTGTENVQETQFYDLNFFSEEVNWRALTKELSGINWRLLFRKCSPGEMMETFLDLCLDISKRHVPLKRRSQATSRKPQNIPRHRRNFMRTRRRIQKQILSTLSESRKQALRRRLIEIEKQLQSSYAAEKETEERKAVDKIRSNSKYFFSYAKRFTSIKVGIGPLLDAAKSIVSCPTKMAEILSNQYASVFSQPVYTDAELDTLFVEDNPEYGISNIDFNEDDILQAMGEFSCNSAAGPDGFPAKLLKECRVSLSHPIYLIWRKSMTQGVVPASCKVANIIPIHKGKSRSEAKNYRPVALTSLLVKTFEKVIRQKLVDYFNENNMFNDNQHGFRGARSCLSQLLSHFDMITRLMEAGEAVDVIYLDFAKAFDKVDIGITLQKLKSLGIKGSLGGWLHSFLTGRSQTVLVSGAKSSPRSVLSGVPQGSVLGPLLFLILIGDIDQDIVKSFISSFADDTRIGHGITTAQDMEELQADLEAVYRWANVNNMEFNSDKFEHIRYEPSKSHRIPAEKKYLSNTGSPITQKNHLRDLGVTISDDATFSQYIEEKINKMKSKIGWVLRTFRTREPKPMLTLWKSLILSEHDYCSQLWNPQRKGKIQSLDQIQHSFLKKIHTVSDLTYWDQLTALGLYSLQRRRERYTAIYTWKILEGLVPNIASGEDALSAKWHPRRGRECAVPKVSTTAPVRIQTIRRSSFAINGPRIFNSLPQQIRDITGCELSAFKPKLDKVLSKIPDQPPIPGYTAYRQCDTNSLIDWLGNSQLRLEELSRQNDVEDLAAAIHGDHGR